MPADQVLWWRGAPLAAGTPMPLDMTTHESKTYVIDVRAPPGKTVENIRVRTGLPAEMAQVVAPDSVSGKGTIRITVHGRALFDAPIDTSRMATIIDYDVARRFG